MFFIYLCNVSSGHLFFDLLHLIIRNCSFRRDQGITRAETRMLEVCVGKKEMKVNRSKTEYLCKNGGNDEETVKMEDKKVLRVKEFKYLGSTVQESGSCEREVKRRVQTGWNR